MIWEPVSHSTFLISDVYYERDIMIKVTNWMLMERCADDTKNTER